MGQQAFDLWVEFEITSPWGELEHDFFTMLITVEDGRRYALSVWTFAFLDRARSHAAEAGERLGGRYLLAPDLLVERLDREHLERVTADLIASGGLRDEWLHTVDA